MLAFKIENETDLHVKVVSFLNPIPGGVFHHRIPGGYGKFASPNFSMK